MDTKVVLLHMAGRLYEDIKFVTEQNPTQIVDEDGARAYNNLVSRAKKAFTTADFFEDFNEWSPRTIKYKDALVVAGQFCALIEAMSEGQRRVQSITARAAAAPPPSPAPAAAPQAAPPPRVQAAPPAPVAQAPAAPKEPIGDQEPADMTDFDHDEELYGNAPLQRNEDGTIPFSLD